MSRMYEEKLKVDLYLPAIWIVLCVSDIFGKAPIE